MENFLLVKIILFVAKIASIFTNYPDLSKSNKYVCSIPSKFEDYEYSNLMSTAPPILSVDSFYQEITVNESFEVECTGHKPLTWIIHNYGHVYNTSTVIITEMEYATYTTKLYRSRLAITDPSFTDTRLYHCLYNEKDKLSTDNSFYLYVNDDMNLLLPVPSTIDFCPKFDLTVPCRPTNSRANVTLWKTFSERPKVQIPLENSIVSYDPSEGFQILQKSFFYEGEFLCQAQLDERIETKEIRIDFDGIYPTINIQTEISSSIKYFSTNKLHKIICTVEAYEGDNVWFEWRKCQDVQCKSLSFRIIFDGKQNLKEYPKENGLVEIKNLIEVNATESGEYICVCGRYRSEIENKILLFTVSDVAGGFDIIARTMTPVEGDHVTVECRANIIHYSNITFQHSNSIPNADAVETNNGFTNYSITSEIKFFNISKDFNETLICSAQSVEKGAIERRRVTLLALPASKPKFLSNDHVEDIKLRHDLSQPILNCSAAGVPTPITKWFKNGQPIRNSTAMDIIGSNGQLLLIKLLTKTLVEGHYVCNVSNRAGFIQRSFKVYDVVSSSATIVWAVILAIGLVLLLVTITISVRLIRQKKLEKSELNAIISDLNHAGRLDKVDPNAPIDEQVDYLPYDKKWEFNENRLKLGTILGQGAFGKVVKAQAIGINNEETVTVAVKTTKDRANIPQIKLLISELKILIHIGNHLNIANLLGAVTKNIIRGDLMIIVEYCRFGCLRNFLIRATNQFVNQVDPKTGSIDFKINNDQLDSVTNEIFDENSTSEGGFISSLRRSDDPECKTISTSDLICYSYQVSKGMSYLSSKKILHRDLAARNVLLADNNIVKICDFGLAKDCYHSNYYKLQGNGALPIKWLAIESLEKKVFTTESDAWSFGILLWEFFTLGGDPYPGMNIDEEFLNKLKGGYRMDIPQYAPKCVYRLMLKCWNENPESRPSFDQLGKELSEFLQESTNNVYLQLETEYVKMSSVQFEMENEINNENGFDYLRMNKVASVDNQWSAGEPSGSTDEFKYVNMDKETKPEMIDLVSVANIDTNINDPTMSDNNQPLYLRIY